MREKKKILLLIILFLFLSSFVQFSEIQSASSTTNGIFVYDDFAFLVLYERPAFNIMNISNPNNPTLIKSIDVDCDFISEIYVSNNFLYLLASEVNPSSTSLLIYDISDIYQLELIKNYKLNAISHRLHVSNNTVVLVILDDSNKLRVIDVSYPYNPLNLGEYSDCYVNDVYVRDNLVFICSNNVGLKIIDISSPYGFNIIGQYYCEGIDGFYIEGNTVYLKSRISSDFYIIDVSNPSSPSLINTLSIFFPFFVLDGKLYHQQPDGLLAIVDVSNPISPITLSVFDLELNHHLYYTRFFVYNDHIYITNSKLVIVNVEDPTNPSIISRTRIYIPSIRIRNIVLIISTILILLTLIAIVFLRRNVIKETFVHMKKIPLNMSKLMKIIFFFFIGLFVVLTIIGIILMVDEPLFGIGIIFMVLIPTFFGSQLLVLILFFLILYFKARKELKIEKKETNSFIH